ncbi:hypothetical protein [Paenibacillus tengchongensis]|uniref:hypothetical protein n=1 Tax=Paenibacillus tengchongensis TaxID=2608684 RepID=UPI00124CA692|nr:hypothetical protein [Paenibacillus tengchongensis]
MIKLKQAMLALLVLLVATGGSAGKAAASGTALTPSIQAAFDLTAAQADSAARARLLSLYQELTGLEAQYDKREEEIRRLHDGNAQALIALRAKIKELDQAAVSRATATVETAKKRYQPLFDQYSALNKQIALLKGLKDKALNAALRTQADAMKLLVQAARQDIREKEAQLKQVKQKRTDKMASARKTLSGIDSPQSSIKTQKSAASALNKRLSADFSDFKAAIRKKNAPLALQSLSSLVSGYKQIAVNKQKIVELEQKVSSVIAAVNKQIAG